VFDENLHNLKQKNLSRRILDRSSPQERSITIQGKTFLNFASNDYLGLSNHPSLKEAVIRTAKEYGAGSGASRLLSGGTDLHIHLEQILADLKGTESALVYNSGYSANTGSIPSLADRDAVIFSDEFNHASIIDVCRLCKCNVIIYHHKDLGDLEQLIRKYKRKKSLIITDSVFSMDGDIAPIRELHEIALKYHALLYIDDAHGTGVLGNGKGALHHFGIPADDSIVQMGTLSKALGSFGAFIAASKDIIEWQINVSRSLIYSTALPPHVVAASIEAMKIMSRDLSRRERLWKNRSVLIDGLRSLDLDTGSSETPIVPVLLKDNSSALQVAGFLYEHGIYAPAIRYPTVRTPRLRLTVTSETTEEDIFCLLKVLQEVKDCRLL
jgi:8-amino-7-oxononanoate synthase